VNPRLACLNDRIRSGSALDNVRLGSATSPEGKREALKQKMTKIPDVGFQVP
jgi:hypothetical protein